MIIKPFNEAGSNYTGQLVNITPQAIADKLGFPPNVKDDPFKVKHSWGFTANGKVCGIWEYKDSHKYGNFSFCGPMETMIEIFGVEHVKD